MNPQGKDGTATTRKQWRPSRRLLTLLGAPAIFSALVGLAGSYAAIQHYLQDLGWLSHAAPAVLELTVLYLAVSMLVRTRMGARWRPERLFVYAGIGLAAHLNWNAYTDISTAERAWHAAMPLLWAIAIEWALAWAKTLLELEEPEREGVPFGVWVTKPIFAWSIQRLMWLTGTRTYSAGVQLHLRTRLAKAEHKGAPASKLAAIRLKYAIVRPSAAALTAGDGEDVDPVTGEGAVNPHRSAGGGRTRPSPARKRTRVNDSAGAGAAGSEAGADGKLRTKRPSASTDAGEAAWSPEVLDGLTDDDLVRRLRDDLPAEFVETDWPTLSGRRIRLAYGIGTAMATAIFNRYKEVRDRRAGEGSEHAAGPLTAPSPAAGEAASEAATGTQ